MVKLSCDVDVQRKSQKVNLKMNVEKTQVMLNNCILDHEIKVEDEVTKCLVIYLCKYLDQIFGASQVQKKRKKIG